MDIAEFFVEVFDLKHEGVRRWIHRLPPLSKKRLKCFFLQPVKGIKNVFSCNVKSRPPAFAGTIKKGILTRYYD